MALQKRRILAPLRDMLEEQKQESPTAEIIDLEEKTAVELVTKQEESVPVIEEEIKTEEPILAAEVSEEKTEVDETVNSVEENAATSDTNNEEVVAETTEEVAETVEEVTEKTAEDTTVEDTKEEVVEEVKEESQEEKPKKRTRASSKKKTLETEDGEEKVEVINVSNSIGRQNLQDVVAAVIQEYKDPEFEEFKERLEENLKRTSFDDRADTGVVKMILANLSCCYDNVTKEYARVNSSLSQLNNKSYGLITRQIALNSVGTNDAIRKRNGMHAPEIYKTSNGKTINLYGVEAALEKQAFYLQMIMKQLDYKRSTLIAYLTANKYEADNLGA